MSLGAWLACAPLQPAHATGTLTARAVADLSLEELRNVVVLSVSRREQRLADAAASIYVISGDEIRRTGVTSLPEALRLAPNLEVAALDNRQYAISARGFNTNIANKLLVLMDGRTLYSPLFAGVFWDVQDFAPDEIDRIEVISGPAGAAWGTNAVNGVINIVTLPASRTQGTAARVSGGNRERSVQLRHGFSSGDGLSVRGHLKAFERDASLLRSGAPAHDEVSGFTGSLRADWRAGADQLRVDAGGNAGHTGDRPLYGEVKTSGAHLLAHWTRTLGDEQQLEVQGSYDRMHRRDRYLLQDRAQVIDLEGRYRRVAGDHRLMAGAGYRRSEDEAEPGLVFAFLPERQTLDWYSLFVQDEILIGRSATLTLGTRFEHNAYTGWETLPSLRLGYRLGTETLLWGAVSRAVRSPARLDREIYTPPQPPFVVAGGPNFRSEVAKVLEGGVRRQFGASASFSATAFVQSYDHLRSAQLVDGAVRIENGIEGQVRGIEAWGEWQPHPRWKLFAGLLLLDMDLRLKEGSNDPVGPSNLGNDPSSQWSLRSHHALGGQAELSLSVRRVGRLPQPEVPAYTATDLQLNWQPRPEFEVSLGVRNAFDSRHLEYDAGALAGEMARTVFVTLEYQLQ